MSSNINMEEILLQINEMTLVYREFMMKEFFIVIGLALYISFLVMSLYYYSPNYFACLGYYPMFYNLFLICCHALLVILVLIHLLQNNFSVESKAIYTYFGPKLFILVFLCMFFSYAYLYFKCNDTLCSKQDKCSIEKMTEFNTKINEQVSGMKQIRQISSFYEKLNNDLPEGGKTNIARCSNFYDNSYLQTINDDDETQCSNADFDSKKCMIGTDPSKSAPILSEFFIMSSNKTCVVKDQFDSYVSSKMIEIALKAGYRCLDFDLYPISHAKDAFPIVTVSQNRLNHNMQHNYVTWQDCCKTIVDSYFIDKSRRDISLSEPLFLHLNIHPQCTQMTQDQIALLIKYYFTEYGRNVLLDSSDYNYRQRKNFGETNICELFGKVIIMVRLVGSETKEQTKLSTAMKEVTNILNGSNIKDKEWKDIKSVLNVKNFQTFTKRHLVYCRSSMFPYSKLSIEQHKKKKDEIENAQELQIERSAEFIDNVGLLLINKATINNNPNIPVQLGCQFIAMNISRFDDDLMKYLSFFKYASYVLKPKELRRKPILYTKPIESRYSGTIPGVSCTTETSDLNTKEVNQATCKSQESQEAMRIKSNDLKKSYNKNISKIKNIQKQPVFYNKKTE